MNNLKKNFAKGLLGIIAVFLMTDYVQAMEDPTRGPASFADFDTDENGFVSEQEFNALRAQRMAAKAAEGKQMKGAATAPSFADVDTDGDGQINPEELTSAQKAHMEKQHSMGKGHGMGHGEGQGAGKGMGQKDHMPAFSDFDLDGDGMIVESEFNQAHAARMSEMAAQGRQMKHVGEMPGFSGIDSNDDGVISEQEFSTHQQEHHQQMQKNKDK